MESKERIVSCACRFFFCPIGISESIHKRGLVSEIQGEELIGRPRSIIKMLKLKGCTEVTCEKLKNINK